jgi:hypothetical protein
MKVIIGIVIGVILGIAGTVIAFIREFTKGRR